jgi:hypothetical protein
MFSGSVASVTLVGQLLSSGFSHYWQFPISLLLFVDLNERSKRERDLLEFIHITVCL